MSVPVNPKLILKEVASHFHLRQYDIKRQRKTKRLVRPRQIAMYLIRKMTDLSFPDIGEMIGGRDHSTAIHACNKIESLVSTDRSLGEVLEALETKIHKPTGG